MANEKQMCAELESNCTKNNERLLELMKTYELAKLGNEVQRQAFDDINKVMELALPLQVERGLTDDKGYYITNWMTIEVEAKQELVNFIISHILPDSMAAVFMKVNHNVVYQDKLLDIIYKQFKTKEQ